VVEVDDRLLFEDGLVLFVDDLVLGEGSSAQKDRSQYSSCHKALHFCSSGQLATLTTPTSRHHASTRVPTKGGALYWKLPLLRYPTLPRRGSLGGGGARSGRRGGRSGRRRGLAVRGGRRVLSRLLRAV